MKFNLCDKNYNIIHENIDVKILAEFTGYKTKSFMDKIYHRDTDKLVIKDTYIEVVDKERAPLKNMDNFWKDWDCMTIAAELIRTGQGKIKTFLVDGEYRKVTVPR